MQKRIAFLAPTGVGKSTAAGLLAALFDGEIVKLALPLYQLQKIFYKYLGLTISGQDGELLQFLGDKVQREAPDFLANKFTKLVNNSTAPLLINDDCRPHNYAALKKLGFVFIKIEGPTRKRVHEHSPLKANHIVEWKEPIPSDFTIRNHGTLEDLERELRLVMKQL